ncbi:HNH endonuclease [Blastococcus sp. TF02-8]|uniref:HNH endonuclease signature motif containing protein n=1 Tax=Blastococcus sp. TF02-8 TaxID=2250574 RepID=UPI000DE81785|nr:HNH endonuclease signature motif containing protein [Blastococcus sp. TF02-8]RBY97601.1 HNH endonuclease [Blastococcus sp. TF02-8]
MDPAGGTSLLEESLRDLLAAAPERGSLAPASRLGAGEVAAELARIQRNRAREAAREAELILRLAELCPDADDPRPGTPGARRTWRRTEPEFAGVSEFFPDELAHAINLGRGTAAFRARRAFTWRENLPATFAALRSGRLDERRAGVLADSLQHADPDLARAVEAALLDEASTTAPAALRTRALALLAELDAAAVERRHREAKKAADVRTYETGDGMAALTTDLPADEAAACYAMIDQLARMAKADGDERPIGEIRSSIHSLLIRRPADSGLPGVGVQLAVTATLETLEGSSGRPGEVNGSVITAAQLRDLLRRVGALALTAPDGGTLTFALTDERGRLLAGLTAAELARLAARGCPDHPDAGEAGAGCECPVSGPPPDTDAYTPTTAQHRFVDTRDRRCRMPNCGQRAGWADHDHVVPHARGGTTTCSNLCCLCRSHHRLKTFAPGWVFRMDDDGTLHVTSPSGVTRTTRPPGLRPRAPDPASADQAHVGAVDPPPF